MSRGNETSGRISAITFRDATERDLPTLLRVTLAALGSRDLADEVSSSDIHPFHRFATQHGRVLVADVDDAVAGYGAVIQLCNHRILSQLFVTETLQSRNVGRKLLERLDQTDGRDRILLATNDPRAVSLYVRRGYVPGWPIYSVHIPSPAIERLTVGAVRAQKSEIGKRIAELDRKISGLDRPDVYRYWERESGGACYEISIQEATVGYGWIHDPARGSLSRWHGNDPALEIGPVGAIDRGDAEATVSALLQEVNHQYRGRDAVIEIGGPHPALPALLRAGGRIIDAELTMSTNRFAFGHPELYVPSGGILF